MKEYREFKYAEKTKGKWSLIFPSGFKTTASLETEEELKAEIDKLIDG